MAKDSYGPEAWKAWGATREENNLGQAHVKLPTVQGVLDRYEARMHDYCYWTHEEVTALIEEVKSLRLELAKEREKFLMHTAEVGAWLSTLADLFDARGVNVSETCLKVFVAAQALKAKSAPDGITGE